MSLDTLQSHAQLIDTLARCYHQLKQKFVAVDDQAQLENWLREVLRRLYVLAKPYVSAETLQRMVATIRSAAKEEPHTRQQISISDNEFVSGHNYFCGGKLIQIVRTTPRLAWRSGKHTIYDLNGRQAAFWEEHSTTVANVLFCAEAFAKLPNANEAAIALIEKLLTTNYNLAQEKLGRSASPLRRSQVSRHRHTHCYKCKLPLESGVFLECGSCAWLVCSCGACGCGYGPNHPGF